MSGRRSRRTWTAAHTATAVTVLHGMRAEFARLTAEAPINSPEYEACSTVMTTTAAALRVFGHDVMSWPAKAPR